MLELRASGSLSLWLLRPLRTPHVLRSCPRCQERRSFICSDKFRVNAQKRRLDVWLIYRCAGCDYTWNHPLLERVAPESIDPERYQAYLQNERGRAWAEAFALRSPEREREVPFVVEGVDLASGGAQLCLPWPLEVRLERLLARVLGLSRSGVERAVRAGGLWISGDPSSALRRSARPGQEIRWAPELAGAAAAAGRPPR